MNYFDIQRISNSALSCIDPETGGHPEKYKDFIDGKLKFESASMQLGDIIHRHLLLGEHFVALDKKPGEAVARIVEAYHQQMHDWGFQHPSIDADKELLLQLVRENNYYNNRKDSTVVETIIKEGKEYFDFLSMKMGVTAIPAEWMAILEKLSVSVLQKSIDSLLNPAPEIHIEVLTEKEVFFDLESLSFLGLPEYFECKAKIDRLIVDHHRKTYILVDLKSTGSLLEKFPESVSKYKYYRQVAFYNEAVKSLLPAGYSEEAVFLIALETISYNRARAFRIDPKLLLHGKKDYEALLKRVSYHKSTGNWLSPIEEETNQGIYHFGLECLHQHQKQPQEVRDSISQ